MDERKRLILLLAVFPLTLLLLLVFRGAIREWIVVPLLSLVWFLNQAVFGLYQGILWFILLLGVVLFIFASLRRFSETKYHYENEKRRRVETGKVHYWSNIVYQAGRGRVSLPFITSRLREELFTLIGYRQNLKLAEVEQRVQEGIIRIPEDIKRFLYMQERPFENNNIFGEISHYIRLYIPLQNGAYRQWIMKKIERTISYMEEIMDMETKNDHADR
jgi:hypothetical protein